MDIESKQKLMRKLKQMKQGVLMISHDQDVLEYADKIIYIRNGMVEGQGTIEELGKKN